MKFGKNLMRVVETSDPEWGPYWINYKFLKKKVYDIVESKGGIKITDKTLARNPGELSKCTSEVEFFRLLRSELKKSSDFFTSIEQIYKIRKERIWEGFRMLENEDVVQEKNTWTRLLMACVKFYKDVLLIENYAIMNYCGFSKILKKHDKLTGFVTRDAFMRNVMNHQNFTHYPYIMQLIRDAEQLFAKIQKMESVMPLQDEERLFIEAMRDLNNQASKLQAEEKGPPPSTTTTSSSATTTATDASASLTAIDTTASAVVTSAIPIATVIPTATVTTAIPVAATTSTTTTTTARTIPVLVPVMESSSAMEVNKAPGGDARLSAAALHAYEQAQRLHIHSRSRTLPPHLTTTGTTSTTTDTMHQHEYNTTKQQYTSSSSSSNSSSGSSSPYSEYKGVVQHSKQQKRTATQAGLSE